VSGATNATFTLTNVSPSDAATYSVLVTNSYGSALSSNAMLTVYTVLPPAGYVPPTYLFQIDASAVPGGSFIPQYLALDSSNNVYVTDSDNTRIFKFSALGTYLAQWGSFGTGNGQFYGPGGVAVDSSNNVYVPDFGLPSRIQKFDSNGDYLTQWAIESDLGNFNGPEGVAVDSGNNIYVTAPQNCLVEKFDSNGNYLTQWGNAELYIPAGVAVDSSNNVYVASEYDNQIVKFDSDGNYLTQWGSQGSGNGQFEYPKGIAVDSGNDVYVTDIENDRVEKFDSNGDYLTQWGDYGGGNGQFTYPVGVAVDRTGNYIYVADQEGGRIEVFANNTNIIPPFITQPPTNQTVPAGVSVTFSVIVVGAAPLAYQWSSNNVAMSGATNVTFTVTNVSLADSGSAYSVLVTNSYGSAFSSNATLTVLPVAEYVPPTYLFQFDASAVPGGIVISGYLALDSSNNVYVSDGSNSRIVKFTSNGTFLTQWGSYGSGNGQFDFPYLPGIAVDSDNNVYVADSGNARVEKFESNGNYLTQWGSSGNGNGQFSVPLGVAVDSSNNVYVTDEQIARIEKFDSSGNYLTQWGSYGSYVNELLTPAGIAVDSSNNVYVAESIYDADLVEKFDSNGNHLAQWGSYGSGNGQFDNDNGGAIAADRSNNVYVTDIYNNRIEKFDSNGTYLTQWGSYGSGNGQFDGPDGVAVDSTGNFIYVTDPGNGRIEVFANNVNNLPPYITSQPASQTVPGSINVTFSVSVAGGAPFAYQWTSNNVGVPGATNATFTLTNVNLSQSGSAYAVLVTNNYGSLLSSNALLTIVPAVAITLPASSITTTGAVLNGSVTVGPDETVTWFEWGTETNYGNIAGETIVPGDNGSNNISSTLSGLPGNIYYYRMDVANDFGIVYGNDVSFTVGLAPSATTLAAVNRTNGWTLNASVNPNGWDTTVYFLWETDYHNYNLTNSTPVMDAGAGATALNVSNLITGLAPTTRYYYEVWASNYLGIAAGSLVSFLSPPFTSAPLAEWRSVTASADGSKLVAAAGGIGNNQIITSTDSGANWTQVTNASFESWGSVASSADGTKMVAAPYSSIRGTIYVSTNSGADWTPATNAPGSEWITVASSADGMKLAAGALKLMGVYTSTNAGVNWTCQTNGLGSYSGIAHIASSADGSELVATTPGNGYGPIFTSTNSGINWIQATNAPIAYWTSVACSADGNTLMACFNSLVYLSTDAGVTWIIASLPAKNWSSVAESADGTKMTALANSGSATLGVGSGGIYTSTDSGTTWVSNNAPSWTWTCAAMSADGNEIIAAVGSPSGSGSIYVLQTIPAPRLNLSASNNDNFISWIIPSLDFTLQRSPDLSSWTDLTNQPVLNLTNLQNQVTLPPPDGNSFFRLMH
jgi:DNA-binding beta-propeller fold protein YncE